MSRWTYVLSRWSVVRWVLVVGLVVVGPWSLLAWWVAVGRTVVGHVGRQLQVALEPEG
jgi:hypothetical protein